MSIRFGSRIIGLVMNLIRGRRPATSDWDTMVLRCVRRCEFPNAGEITQVTLPVDEDGFDASGWGGLQILRGSDGGSHVVVRDITLIPRRIQWLLPYIARKFTASYSTEWDKFALEDRLGQMVPAEGFLVLRLRKCTRGPPLTPLKTSELGHRPEGSLFSLDDMHWGLDNDGDFHLCRYLRRLLTFCGLSPDSVFDSLDGRFVVFYQAVVRRDAWHSLWAAVEPSFKRQQSAYRYWYGGSAAPTLSVDVPPFFVKSESERVPGDVERADDSLPWSWQAAHSKNSFLHFVCREHRDDALTA